MGLVMSQVKSMMGLCSLITAASKFQFCMENLPSEISM